MEIHIDLDLDSVLKRKCTSCDKLKLIRNFEYNRYKKGEEHSRERRKICSTCKRWRKQYLRDNPDAERIERKIPEDLQRHIVNMSNPAQSTWSVSGVTYKKCSQCGKCAPANLCTGRTCRQCIANKRNRNKMKESEAVDRLIQTMGDKNPRREVNCAYGRIDVLTDEEVIEVKSYDEYKHAIGQVLCYGLCHPDKRKRVHIFGEHSEIVRRACDDLGIGYSHDNHLTQMVQNDLQQRADGRSKITKFFCAVDKKIPGVINE